METVEERIIEVECRLISLICLLKFLGGKREENRGKYL